MTITPRSARYQWDYSTHVAARLRHSYLTDLIHDIPDVRLREEFVSVFHQLIQILLHVFKDEVELIVFSNDFAEFDHVGVTQLLQRLHRGQGGWGRRGGWYGCMRMGEKHPNGGVKVVIIHAQNACDSKWFNFSEGPHRPSAKVVSHICFGFEDIPFFHFHLWSFWVFDSPFSQGFTIQTIK